MKVGHLYFSGSGRYPAFYSADGTLFSELCWGDYAADAVLRSIEEHVAEAPDPLASFSGSGSASASFSLPKTLSADGSVNAGAKVSGIKRLTLTPTGLDAVLSNLGPDCLKTITTYSKTSQVVLLMSAQRADTMTISSSAKVNLEATLGDLIGLTPVRAGGTADQTLEYKLVYLSSHLTSTDPDQP